MCGIVGFSGTNNYDREHIKSLLLWNSLERGQDSTGIYTVTSGLIKDNVSANKFIKENLNKNKKKSKVKEDNILIAHVRKKSVGANTVNNAHPHDYGNTILVHNGTLKNYNQLAKEYGIASSSYFSDSQVLANILDINFNNDEAFKVLKEYEGAAACLLYNKEEGNLYAFRDSERPMFYGFVDNGMYISSIKDTLEYIECSDIEEFKANKIYKIKDGAILEINDYPKREVVVSGDIKLAYGHDIYDLYDHTLGRKTFMFRSDEFTGISRANVTAEHLIGYNLKYTGHTIRYHVEYAKNQKGASVTRNQYYQVVDVSEKNTNLAIILDDNHLLREVPITDLNTSNFVPLKDGYVQLTNDIISHDAKPTGNEGDVFVVIEHIFGKEMVEAKCIYDGHTIYIRSRLCRVCEKEEAEYAIKMASAMAMNRSQNLALPESKTNIEDDCEDGSCRVDYGKKIKEEINDEELRGVEHDFGEHDDEESFISSTLVHNFIIDLGLKVESIKERYDKNEDIATHLENLTLHILNSTDETYLESVFES